MTVTNHFKLDLGTSLRAADDHVAKPISAALSSSKYCDFIFRALQNASTFPQCQNTREQDPLNHSANQAGGVLLR